MIRTDTIRCLVLIGVLTVAACTSTNREPENWDPARRADVHTQLAWNYMQRNQLEVARDELDNALAGKPDHSGANHAMAMLQSRLGNLDAADRYFRKAIESDAENSQAASDYGLFLCRQGKVSEAMKYFDKALANPLYLGTAITSVAAGECLMTMRDKPRLEDAERYFRSALAKNPTLPPALYGMAEISYRKQKYLSARGYIERYFAVSAETPKTLLLAAKVERKLGAVAVAEDYAKRLRSQFPSSDEAKQLK